MRTLRATWAVFVWLLERRGDITILRPYGHPNVLTIMRGDDS